MALTPGTRLGPYEVVAPLGAGGMGEVYRARDTRLPREVALKVLRSEGAADPDRVRRFEQEARALAALNHPHILTMHDVLSHEGAPVVVAELLDGRTLRAELDQAPDRRLSVRRTAAIARQVADGLAAGHDKGIAHRDLKPENVFVTTDGHVKILDYGLAKAFGPAEGAPLAGDDGATTATGSGTIVGTVGYMAPERVRGEPADHRVDLFALGVMLHEMVSGARPFMRGTTVETLSAILTDEPPELSGLARDVPTEFARVVRHCLEKRPADRFQSARDLAFQLVGFENGTTTSPHREDRASLGLSRVASWAGWVVAAVVVGAVAVTIGLADRGEGETTAGSPSRVARFAITPPSRIGGGGRPVVTISPDGRQIVVAAADRLLVRSLSDLEFRPVAADDLAGTSVFSPDGRHLAYFTTAGALKRVAVSGGPPTMLHPAAGEPFGAVWAGNRIIYGLGRRGIFAVSAEGGEPTLLVKADESVGEVLHGPQLLPGGDLLLFTAKSDDDSRWDDADIVVQSLGTGRRTTLVRGATDARYVSTSHLLYVRQDSMFAQPLALDTLTLGGSPTVVTEGLRPTTVQATTGTRNYAVSDNGTLAYIQTLQNPRHLVWRDRTGRGDRVFAPPAPYLRPRFSPDGTKLVVANQAESDLWVMDLAQATAVRLTRGGVGGIAGDCTRDGQRILYTAANGLFALPADGSGTAARVARLPAGGTVSALRADGRTAIVFVESNVALVTLDPDAEPQRLLYSPAVTAGAGLSPDERWLVYYGNESGRMEVYVRPFPEVGSARWQISTAGGSNPRWMPSGGEIVYQGPDSYLYAVRVRTTGGFTAGRPERLFEVSAPTASRHWDVAPDGTRFVALEDDGESDINPVVVVQHFFDVLKAKLSASR